MDHWRPRFSWFGIITLIFLLMPLLATCGSSPPTVAGPSVSMNEFTPATLHIQQGHTGSTNSSTTALSQTHAAVATLRVPEDYPTIQGLTRVGF